MKLLNNYKKIYTSTIYCSSGLWFVICDTGRSFGRMILHSRTSYHTYVLYIGPSSLLIYLWTTHARHSLTFNKTLFYVLYNALSTASITSQIIVLWTNDSSSWCVTIGGLTTYNNKQTNKQVLYIIVDWRICILLFICIALLSNNILTIVNTL